MRHWALDSAREVLSLRDRLIGEIAAREQVELERDRLRAEVEQLRGSARSEQDLERLVAERIEMEHEISRLGRENYEMNGTLDQITSTRIWRFGRRLRAPLRSLRLWK